MMQMIIDNIPFKQGMKFLATGVMNTAIDFAILNLLILLFGLATGDPRYILFKAIAYIAASCNSFVFNKMWVFKERALTPQINKEIKSFAVASALGLCVNALVSLGIFHGGSALFPLADPLFLANGAALAAGVVLCAVVAGHLAVGDARNHPDFSPASLDAAGLAISVSISAAVEVLVLSIIMVIRDRGLLNMEFWSGVGPSPATTNWPCCTVTLSKPESTT